MLLYRPMQLNQAGYTYKAVNEHINGIQSVESMSAERTEDKGSCKKD